MSDSCGTYRSFVTKTLNSGSHPIGSKVEDNPSHPCSQPQGQLDPLLNGENLWYNVCDHGNKFFKHPIMRYNSLLNSFPDCGRHQTNWWNQEPQNRKGKPRCMPTCTITKGVHFNTKLLCNILLCLYFCWLKILSLGLFVYLSEIGSL